MGGMSFTPSITLNTGLPPALQLLEPGVRAQPAPSDRVQMHVFERVLQSDPLGSWAGDPWAQTNHFRDTAYVAIRAFMDAISGATVTPVGLDESRAVRKAMPTPGQQGRDTDYTPLDDEHPLSQVIESPNGEDGSWTMSQELAYIALQAHLTGIAPVWTPFNEQGKPVQFFALPSFTTQPIYQAGQNPQYPKGAYRVNPYAGGGWYSPAGLSATTILPGEEVKRFRFQSPFNRWDGYSPLTAGAVTIDILESVDRSRHSAMSKGVRMDAMAVIPGATQDEAEAFAAKMRGKHSGPENAGTFGAIGVPSGLDGGKFSLQTYSIPSREMDYTGSWDQVVGAVLAIFRVPKSVAGLATATSYSELYAALRQFNELALKPFARQLSDFLTKSLAAPWSEKRGALKIQVDLPTLDDPDLLEKQLAADVNIRTVNQRLAIRNLPPVEGGDVPEPIYLAKLQQQIAPPPMPAQPPVPGEKQPEGNGPAPKPNPFTGTDTPTAGAAPKPENAAARGTGIPRVGKAMNRSRRVQRAVARVLEPLNQE